MKHIPEGVELRIVVPRESLPVAPAPEYYSQRNCDLLGIGHRTYLELLRRPGAPAVTKIGKLRLVKREEMLAFMERLRELERAREIPESELDGADRVLMEMGCAPTKKRKAG